MDHAFFAALADALCAATDGAERVMLHLQAEASHFIRFNRGAVRQATQVNQSTATLSVVRRLRRIECTLTLTGRLDDDVRALREERLALAAQLDAVADDPYLLLPDAATRSMRQDAGQLPAPEDVVGAVASAAHGLDFVGFYAGGAVVRAFADSLGSRHWHRVESFHFDWCLYAAGDKAVKTTYAGTHWRAADFAERVAQGARQLPLLALPPRQLAPGAYRAYFAPAAVGELLGTLGWSGFSLKARRSGGSSLARLARG
jgi:predicted Zn-dependent protease